MTTIETSTRIRAYSGSTSAIHLLFPELQAVKLTDEPGQGFLRPLAIAAAVILLGGPG